MPARVLVIGIDCLAASLALERWRGRLPTLSRLMEEGTWGPLRSSDPPITVPAWACMLTGRDPGELGLYGFGRRISDEPGDSPAIVTSGDVRFPWVWELAGGAGMDSLVVGVPPTWPPRPMRGSMISDFLAPDTSAPFTWPPRLRDEMEAAAGGPYLLDAPREGEPSELVAAVREMTDRRFRLFTRLLESSEPALAIVVEIGLDRLQHALWHHMDEGHPLHPGPGGPFEDAILDYHLMLDSWIERAIRAAGTGAHVLVVSDHGARRMEGGVRINEWLRKEGWLFVEEGPEGQAPDEIPWGTPLSRCRIDWSRTRAWGAGGYSGRVYLNLEGRQRRGVVPLGRYAEEIAVLTAGLAGIRGPDGAPLEQTTVHRPRDLYRELRGFPPDLLVYFGGLGWRSLGTVGSVASPAWEKADTGADWAEPSSVVSPGNDAGPDGANHSMDGVLVLRQAGLRGEGRVEGLEIHDVFPTILCLLGLEPPEGTLGDPRCRTG